MEKITGNEPAMPFESATENTLLSGHLTGLSIRQHFAAMAMQGMCANNEYAGNILIAKML